MLDRILQRWRERRMWADARTLEDLGELTAQWLEGRIAYQPGYYGPVDVDEDLAPGMRETLARLNRAGFVTSGSQAGFAHDDAGGFTQMAAVEGFATPAAAEALRRAGDNYQVVGGADGVPVSHLDGKPYTTFGRQMSHRGVARVYPGCHRDAITALSTAEKVVICDPQIGSNTLWVALDEAVPQREQENSSVNQYEHDPRVRVDGCGGYTVTGPDGQPLRVLYRQAYGWGIYIDPASEPIRTGYGKPDDAFRTVLGAPRRAANPADIPRSTPATAEPTASHQENPTMAGNRPLTEDEVEACIAAYRAGRGWDDNADHPAGAYTPDDYARNIRNHQAYLRAAHSGEPRHPAKPVTTPVANEDIGDPAADQSDEQYPGYHDAAHLRQLADRCERGAADLQRAADDPAAVLAERGYINHPNTQEWGARKAAAAAAAREYAAHLRTMADDPSYRAPVEQFAEAEKVATAAQCDGILIDGSRLTESSIEQGGQVEAGKQALRDHQAAEDAAVQGSGVFEHVAETIDGVEQVPFWQLGGPQSAADDRAQLDDADHNSPNQQEQETPMNSRDNDQPIDARGSTFGTGNVYHLTADDGTIQDLIDEGRPGRSGDVVSSTTFSGPVSTDGASFDAGDVHNTFVNNERSRVDDDCDGS